MPELPDLEIFKTYLDATALHQEICAVQIKDSIVLEDLTRNKLCEQLVGQAFKASRRYGKYLILELSKKGFLVLHFGMTGDLQYYKIHKKEPEYELVRFEFGNDYRLAYIMPRKLGHIYLSPDVDSFVKQKDLGPDVLDPQFDRKTFRNLLDDRRGMIKTALMDQSLMAGIGNVYSDEILFQARVYPRQKVRNLQNKTINKIFDCMHDVLQTAIERQADPSRFPSDYLTPLRGQNANCPRCSGKIQQLEVAGRSAYYCPTCQEKS
jgi:formamidopyrimidine-DNA glycosylase